MTLLSVQTYNIEPYKIIEQKVSYGIKQKGSFSRRLKKRSAGHNEPQKKLRRNGSPELLKLLVQSRFFKALLLQMENENRL